MTWNLVDLEGPLFLHPVLHTLVLMKLMFINHLGVDSSLAPAGLLFFPNTGGFPKYLPNHLKLVVGRGDAPPCREAIHKSDKPSLHSTCWSQLLFACSLGVGSQHHWSVVLVVDVDLQQHDLLLGLVRRVQHQHCFAGRFMAKWC